MPLKPEDRAAYQREYRKRQRREQIMNTTMPAQAVRSLVDAEDRIKTLKAEVKHLKEELAQRETFDKAGTRMTVNVPASIGPNVRDQIAGGFNSRPFTPAPKKGK